MKLLDFGTSFIDLKKLGSHVLIIRDDKIYTYDKSRDQALSVFSSNFFHPYSESRELKDEIFDIPDEPSLVKAIRDRRCLDVWRVKDIPKTSSDKFNQLRSLGANGHFLGMINWGTKYKLTVGINTIGINQLGETGFTSCGCLSYDYLESTNTQFYHSKNEVEFWKWMLNLAAVNFG